MLGRILVAVSVFSLSLSAIADSYPVVTKSVKIEDRFTFLCDVLRAQEGNPPVWNKRICAQLFFDEGLERFNASYIGYLAGEEYRRALRDARYLVVDETPAPTATPSSTPSPMPTPTPTP